MLGSNSITIVFILIKLTLESLAATITITIKGGWTSKKIVVADRTDSMCCTIRGTKNHLVWSK